MYVCKEAVDVHGLEDGRDGEKDRCTSDPALKGGCVIKVVVVMVRHVNGKVKKKSDEEGKKGRKGKEKVWHLYG